MHDYLDLHYQSPYGDHPEIYRTSPTGYGTVKSEYIGYPSPFPSAHPTPRESIYGKLVPAEFQNTSDYTTQPYQICAGVQRGGVQHGGVTKPARKRRARSSKTTEGAAKQAVLIAAGLTEVKEGAVNRVTAWAEDVEDAKVGVKDEPLN